ncbi:MAG TPA: FHA domain-containing protein [Trebonia sp.]
MPGVYCSQCSRPNPPGARYCSHCGAPLTRTGAAGLSGGLPNGAPGQGGKGPATGGFSAVSETTSMIALNPDADYADPDEPYPDFTAMDSLPPDSALLVVVRGPNAGSRFLLDDDFTSTGRHPDSDIFLDDVTVSRRHAEFYRQGDRFTVRDVGSLNGTYVNRERIEEAGLVGGDEVQIGKFRLLFLTPQSPEVGRRRGSGAQDYA